MIKVTLSIPSQDAQTFTLFADRLSDDLMTAAREVYDDLSGELEDDLRKYPGEVKYPIEWTSERQRRAFFATDGFGAGIPYRRTGALGRSWSVAGTRDEGSFTITIETSSPTARFVVGGLSQVIGPRTTYKQKFHTNTGWQTASDRVDLFVDQYIAQLGMMLKD